MSPKTIQAVYEFVADYTSKHDGLSPTQREIARGCFISLGTVGHYLDILEAQGRLKHEHGQARSIRLIKQN